MIASPRDSLAITARVEDHGLIAAECQRLTGGIPDVGGVAECTRIDRIPRAAYVLRGIRVLARSPDLTELVEQIESVAGEGWDTERFRVDVHDPARRSTMSSTQIATAVADVIQSGPDLDDPLHRFMVVFGEDHLTFGEVLTATDSSYRAHDDKPWTTSSSLDSRFSRALVNLVPDARSVLDPCCGAGTIVLEAASLGLDACGVDRQTAMVGMTRENLARYGYDAEVIQADSRERRDVVDAVVTDLPYGHAIDVDEREIRSILDRCVDAAPLGVFVARADLSSWLRKAGYRDVTTHTVLKRRGFTRWIHEAER